MLNLFGDLSEEEEDEVDSEHESNPQPSFGCNKIIYCATALSTISGDLYRVDQRGVFNLTKAFQKIIGNRNYLMNLPRSCNILATFREFEKQLCKFSG
ncbi:uncharacterized protein LOC125468295 isoform X5 [Pyrus x bretschneideri]|uniref:uncharacterized protein LOC125468295 isoform X4 n=1 Tax=Pyrus x bretschneideri TaxID=225117 RepID=UPI0020301E1B|nr:uncharacterized protein LOC125468295 isoform X4 [Pyrus x bretschneideri]XP_048442197.1 uncharacterized protein LOC125468295 isoform X5 [Pyrus x bretschneideri]